MKKLHQVDINKLFGGLQRQLAASLQSGRDAFSHPSAKGNVTEETWRHLFCDYLPTRYQIHKGFVIDHKGNCSDEIDILIVDRHFSPFLLTFGTGLYVPSESVYAAFEIKQALSSENFGYAQDKLESVRKLTRTSAPIVNMGKSSRPRKKFPILGGLLTSSSDWSPTFGKPFENKLRNSTKSRAIDLGYCMDAGGFEKLPHKSEVRFFEGNNSLVVFILTVINRLQKLGTVPAIEFEKYLANIR